MAKITITELARRLGVSPCTVNKALTGKPKVSEKTRERIVAEAERLGYRPNRSAQVLARKPLRLAYVHPDHFPSFFGPFRQGVVAGVNRLADQRVSVSLHAISPSQWHAEVGSTLRALTRDGLAGLILSPMAGGDDRPVWRLLAEHRVPLVQLGLEVPGSPAVFTVRQDTLLSGRMAAELLAVGSGSVAILIGNRKVVDHAEKLQGFLAEAGRRGLEIAAVCEHEDDAELSHRLLRRLLKKHPQLGGIYVATDNFSGIHRGLRERIPWGTLRVVATGVFAEVRQAMDEGLVHFALDQRMDEQGQLAVQQLHDLLSLHPPKSPRILVPPRIAVRANIDRLSAPADAVEPAAEGTGSLG